MKSAKARPEEQKVPEEPCLICNKPVKAFYGRWGNTGTCSKKCEEAKEAIERSKFLGYV